MSIKVVIMGITFVGGAIMSIKVVIMGAAGDGLVVAQVVKDIERYDNSMQLIGFLDDAGFKEASINKLPVMGGLSDWSTLDDDIVFSPALHKLKQMYHRKKLIEALGIPKSRWAKVIHPTATIADDVEVGYGAFIASHVTVQPGARVAEFASIRAGANVGHDSIVGNYCYVGPNATLCGRAHMETGSHLGPNGVIVDGLVVGEYAIVGAASVVTKNITPFEVCLGNPARKVSSTIAVTKQ